MAILRVIAATDVAAVQTHAQVHPRVAGGDARFAARMHRADRLFEAFYSTKSGGMGIGLSVSRSIIQAHRGRLWAMPNDEAAGATFSSSVPCQHADVSTQTPGAD
jgi:K+-sensing histidine kinase KdpD